MFLIKKTFITILIIALLLIIWINNRKEESPLPLIIDAPVYTYESATPSITEKSPEVPKDDDIDTDTEISTTTPIINPYTIPAGDYTYTINHGGQSRLWLVHVPSSYSGKEPVPMILNFHGAGGNAESAKSSSQMNLHSDKEGYIVVYPEGTGKKILTKLSSYWNVDKFLGRNTDVSGVDDLGFVSAIIDEMSSKFNIDQKRIFATGLSRGGMMTYYLACQTNSKIAAFAPVSSNFANDESTCNPKRPISLIHFHGTADRILPYNGGLSDPALPAALANDIVYLSAKASVEVFAKKNGCSLVQKTTLTKNMTSCVSYQGCQAGSEIILCTLKDAGHTWPGGKYDLDAEWWKKLVGPISYDISANEIMWEFFKKHSLL